MIPFLKGSKMLWRISSVVVLACLALVACGESKEVQGTDTNQNTEASLEGRLILNAEPAGGVAIRGMKESVKDGEDVVIHGRIKDFLGGFAGFTIVDEEMKHCAERHGDQCKTPWDYCCMDKNDMVACTVSVEVHEGGMPVKQSLNGMAGMNQLADVVVKGKATKSSDGNVIVVADGIFVKKVFVDAR